MKFLAQLQTVTLVHVLRAFLGCCARAISMNALRIRAILVIAPILLDLLRTALFALVLRVILVCVARRISMNALRTRAKTAVTAPITSALVRMVTLVHVLLAF